MVLKFAKGLLLSVLVHKVLMALLVSFVVCVYFAFVLGEV